MTRDMKKQYKCKERNNLKFDVVIKPSADNFIMLKGSPEQFCFNSLLEGV